MSRRVRFVAAVFLNLGIVGFPATRVPRTVTCGPFHGSLHVIDANAGTCTYTPAQDYVGPDSIRYHADDGDGPGNTAAIRITAAEGCDCVVSVLDVVSMVNHASRGDASPFCDACADPCP